MIKVTPKSGSIGIIKAPHAAKTTGVTLFSPDFAQPYHQLHESDRIVGAMTGKFDYRWEYIKEEESYLLVVNFYQGKVEFAVQFPKDAAGQILQALVEGGTRVFTLVLKHKEESSKLFDDAVVLMGIELDILPEAGWPVV
ncbi:hypothetical protein JOC37_002366 [Desulfohalotomaculum tongense]|uniref:hypothetical protein n=1 Tax=Desulforadius tongensis TaxID=1216062 RepID=UPI00195BBBBE|nr:hypothetical protein [Desulforadius tongensis]MBM7855943.1 hypothetical protein [Desulforadius tongensis]